MVTPAEPGSPLKETSKKSFLYKNLLVLTFLAQVKNSLSHSIHCFLATGEPKAQKGLALMFREQRLATIFILITLRLVLMQSKESTSFLW